MRPFDELSKTMRNTIERKILLEVAIVKACRSLDNHVRVDYEQRIAVLEEKIKKYNLDLVDYLSVEKKDN